MGCLALASLARNLTRGVPALSEASWRRSEDSGAYSMLDSAANPKAGSRVISGMVLATDSLGRVANLRVLASINWRATQLLETVSMARSTVDPKLRKLRREVRRLYREHIALCVFFHGLSSSDRPQVTASLQQIDKASKRDLRETRTKLKARNEQTAREYGLRVPIAEIVELTEHAESPAVGRQMLLPKSFIRTVCTHYERSLADFNELPDHALVEIDPGRYRTVSGTIEIYLLEAMLFEDMCALFNLWQRHRCPEESTTATKVEIKLEQALAHATTMSAFFFLEAYINGIAIDYHAKNQQNLDDETRITLTEWDHHKNREKFVNFREKLLRYPRIVAGLAHPPLQESNCPELEFLTGNAKNLRDAIAHPSPRPDPTTGDASKVRALLSSAAKDVENVVDAAIGLVRKIETAIKGNDKLLTWLYDRNRDGAFSEDVFK
jgi:hypothetical protein